MCQWFFIQSKWLVVLFTNEIQTIWKRKRDHRTQRMENFTMFISTLRHNYWESCFCFFCCSFSKNVSVRGPYHTPHTNQPGNFFKTNELCPITYDIFPKRVCQAKIHWPGSIKARTYDASDVSERISVARRHTTPLILSFMQPRLKALDQSLWGSW